MVTVIHPRIAPRRGGRRAGTWWGKAWVRAVEESAYGEAELRAARTLSRGGRVGQITVEAGSWVAAVTDEDGVWAVAGAVPELDDGSRSALVETVAAEAGRVAALLAGELPHSLVEHAEEAGVELLPYGGELGSTCSCDFWADPCAHALAVLYQLCWLIDADPFVLMHLRGISREELLAALHELAVPERVGDPAGADGFDEIGGSSPPDDQFDAALDAALRAARVLQLLEEGRPADHLF